ISIFVFRGAELLLQRRAADKYHSAGLWANTCCSHPYWGERVETCAMRRLDEELGMRLPLRAAGSLDYIADVGRGLVENERVHCFVGDYPRDAPGIAPNPHEVADIRWMSVSVLRRDIAAEPAIYAPWLRIYLERAQETGIERLLPQ
ncbi:MAG TPA: NUDIX domain-containing protein, partial [Modicisalibacter sp.]|nr:NUDIX domain-containing protein [Modicisalibacter sp.]